MSYPGLFSKNLKKVIAISGKHYLFGGVTDAFYSVACFDMETMRADGLPKMPYCSYSDQGAAVIHCGTDAGDDVIVSIEFET